MKKIVNLIALISVWLMCQSASINFASKKYVYFTCHAKIGYYSKIFTLTKYSEDNLAELKTCIIDNVKSEAGRDVKVTCTEHVYDSYSKASVAWQEETGKRMFFEGQCDILVRGMK